MNNKKSTKRALLSSVLSLLLCCSMLIGTTFAWFTDEVKSASNIITAGNLDVEVVNKDGKSIEEVTLFDGILWEPGVVAYENITVQNLGTLALKYALYVNFENQNYVVDANGKQTQFGLASALKVAIVEEEITETDREKLVASITDWTSLQELVETGELYPVDQDDTTADTKTYGIVIYWQPGENDNNWNVNNGKTTTDGEPLHITLGINLLATQLMYEEDSYGPDYDEDAKFDALPQASVSTIFAEEVTTLLFKDIINNRGDYETVQLTLDTAYAFKGEPVETAEQNEYADWFVDFFVSLDKAPAEGLVLSGQYDQFLSAWVAFYVPTEGIEAGVFYPLLGAVTGGGVSNWTYTDICSGVGTFNCGAVDMKGLNAGTTMTVQLRLINPENTEEMITVRSVEYTFALNENSPVQWVSDAEALQTAIDNAENGDVIAFAADITGDVTVTQKPDVKFTIDGNGHKFSGTMLVDGKSATYTTAGLTIKRVNFQTDSISSDACINLGKEGDNNTRYTCNVTVDGCTFDVPNAVGVKSYTGGDKNLAIIDCTATDKMHSLVQAKGIDGVLVEGCQVYSKNGLNFNNSDNVTVSGCTVDVKGYAVRFGESSGGSGEAETYLIKDCTLKSANEDGDAVIILRGTADNATLTIENTTLTGTPDITNTATNATVVK